MAEAPTDSVDAATLLVWAAWADDQKLDPNLAKILRRIAKRLNPKVELVHVFTRSPSNPNG